MAAFENIVDVIRQVIDAQAPVQTSCEEKQLRPFPLEERTFRDLPGIHALENEEAWFRIERVERTGPPDLPEDLVPWVSLREDPDSPPYLNELAERVVSSQQLERMLHSGRVHREDIVEEAEGAVRVTIRLSDSPGVRDVFNEYVENTWTPWAEEERQRKHSRELYRSLYELRRDPDAEVAEQPQDLIWGFGLVHWQPASGTSLYYPPLFQTLDVIQEGEAGAAPRRTGRQPSLYVRPRDLQPRLAYAEFAKVDDGGAAGRLQGWWQNLGEDLNLHPSSPDSWTELVRDLGEKLGPDSEFIPPETLPARLRGKSRAPTVFGVQMLFLRRQRIAGKREDALKWLDLIRTEQLQEDSLPQAVQVLSGIAPGAEPRRLGDDMRESLIGVPQDEHGNIIHFPRPANEEQLEAVHRLEYGFGAVVQGPPGTGKSHTIANIICHLLATGRRVLVTAKNPGALTVLRGYLPEGLRSLAVSMLAGQREVDQQFDQAVAKLRSEVAGANVNQLKQAIGDAEKALQDCHKDLINLQRRIEQKVAEHEELLRQVFPDAGGSSLADAIAQFAERESEHGWLADDLTLDEACEPRFGDEDVAQLREARSKLGDDLIHAEGDLPDPSELPDAETIADLDRALRHPPEEYDVVSDAMDVHEEARSLLQRVLGVLAEDPEMPEWTRNYLADQWQDPTPVHRLAEALQPFHETARSLVEKWERLHGAGLDPPGRLHEDKTAVKAIERAASRGKPWRAGGISISRRTRALVDAVRIDGRPPASADEWALALDHVRACQRGEDLVSEWHATITPRFRSEYPTYIDWPRLTGQNGIGGSVERLEQFTSWIVRAAQLLEFQDSLTSTMHKCFGFSTDVKSIALDPARARAAMDAVHARYSGREREEIRQQVGGIRGHIGERMLRLIDSLGHGEGAPIELWDEHRNELLRLRSRILPHVETVRGVTNKIEGSGAAKWAARLRREPPAGDGDAFLPDTWHSAWHWRRQYGELQRSGLYEYFTEASATRQDRERQVRRHLDQLIESRTLRALSERMTRDVMNALNRYQQAIHKIGKGTGKRAPKWRREARKALQDAAPAIPCWIMPEDRVSSEMPAQQGLFDVVVIDEASQSDLTGMLTVLRGEKALIVGDDRQVSPEHNFVSQNLRDAWDRQLREVGEGIRSQLIEGSLYETALVSFGGATLMLKEHFRSHPAIIEFCNREFYSGEVRPLRRPSQSECPPPVIVDLQVDPLVEREANSTNRSEAEAIVAEIEALVEADEGAERSIGVVTMLSGNQQAQAKLIDEFLLDRLGEQAMQKHRIVVGTPPDFQGKERDIVFLSLIERTGAITAKTGTRWNQRFNVAVSRARDRLYVVRSFLESDLKNPNDLKKRLLDYVSSLEKGPSYYESEREALLGQCDSRFEQDVASRLLEGGYQVFPQVKVGPYSIDLVVEDYQGRRLAIELDGDVYHGPERWAADLFRQRVLERAGWRFWRCFASEYYLSPDERFAELEKAIQEQGIRPEGAGAAVPLVERRRAGGDYTLGAPAHEPREPARAPSPLSFGGGDDDEPRDTTTNGEAVVPDTEPGTVAPPEIGGHGLQRSSGAEETATRGDPGFVLRRQSGVDTPDLFVEPEDGTEEPPESPAPGSASFVEVGDTVRYLDIDKNRESLVQIVDGPADASQGIITAWAPLAQALLETEQGDETVADLPMGERVIRVVEIIKAH